MSQSDQQEAEPKRQTQPSNHFSFADPKMVFDGKFSAFRSFGPFKNAMNMAPVTQISVPPIMAIDLKLLMFTFSILTFHNKFTNS